MEQINDVEKIEKNNKTNLKLFKFYQMFSKDLLFYYAISFLFLTQEKNLTVSEILFVEGFYPIFKILIQLFATTIIDNTSRKSSIIIGNIFVALFFIFIILASNIAFFIIANFFLALGFAFKEVTESAFIFDFISDTTAHKRKLFAKIHGKSTSYYFIFSSLSYALSGFIFLLNPYLPVFLGLFFVIIAIILSLFFKEPYTPQKHKLEKIKAEKRYFKELKKGFSFILNSNRLKLLIIFNALFYSCISVCSIYRITILENLNFSSSYTGILCALFGCISAYTAKRAHLVHDHLSNTALTTLSLTYCICIITIACMIFFKLPMFFVYFIVLIMMCVQCTVEGPYTTLILQYLSNFTTPRMRTKIYTVNSLFSEFLYAIITFTSSLLLNNLSLGFSLAILGVSFTLIFVYILSKMHHTVRIKSR